MYSWGNSICWDDSEHIISPLCTALSTYINKMLRDRRCHCRKSNGPLKMMMMEMMTYGRRPELEFASVIKTWQAPSSERAGCV